MANVSHLYDLQGLDWALARGRQRLEVIAASLGNEGSLAQLRQRVGGLEAEAGGLSARQKELDQAVASIVQHVQQVEGRLYGGEVRNPRELSDLQADLGQLTRQRSQQEERLLEVLDQLEGLRNELEGERATLRQQESAWQEAQTAMAGEQDTLRAEQAQLAGRRSALASRVSPADLALYDQVRRHHNGRAVARVERSACEACRVGLSTRHLQELRAGQASVRCPNCGLILVLV